MRSAILISASMLVALTGTALAQDTTAEDDRFKPRVYGNLGVTPAYQNGTVEIYSAPETKVTRIVEPVEPTVTKVINAPVTYKEGGIVKAQHYKQGDLTDSEYKRLLDEAAAVRAYRNVTAPQGEVSSSYEVEMSSQSNTTSVADLPIILNETKTHLVMKGDTLYNISKRYGATIAAIQDANGLSDANISLGQSLKIPTLDIPKESLNTTMKQPIFASAPVQDGYVTRRVVQPVSTATTSQIYAVLKKDTLYSISRRTCVSVGDLISTNNISNPNALTPGQKLTLPSGHCVAK